MVKKAIAQDLIKFKFSEMFLGNRVGMDTESIVQAAALLAHSGTRTTKKHY